MFVVMFLISINSSAFQSWMARNVATYMEKELNTKVHIDRVSFNFYDLITLEGFYVEDLHGDTLVYVPELICGIEKFDFESRELILSEVTLNSPVVGFKQYKGEEDLNFQFLVDYFEDTDTTKSEHPWKVRLQRLKLNGADFAFLDQNSEAPEFGIDFEDIHLKKMIVNVADFHQEGDTTYFKVDELGFKDQSGFKLSSLSAIASISDKKLELKKFALVTEYSSIITDELTFMYDSFGDFDDFISKVYIKSDILPSVLHMSDLSYFVPELEGVYQPIQLKGKVRGKVSELRVKNLELKLSDSVYFKGDISMDGLPDIDNAMISVQIDELMANRDELIVIELPPYDGTKFVDLDYKLNYFGQIHGKGSFLGTIHDFVFNSELRTDIGSLKTDIHFAEDEKTKIVHYSGDLLLSGFNMGVFLENPVLGSITADLVIDAYGFDIEDLKANVKGSIQEIGVADYIYHDIVIDGKFTQNFYDGIVSLHDPNIELEYDGYVNFGYNPAYDFKASIKNAAITKIHLAELTGLDFFKREKNTLMCATIVAKAEGATLDDFRGKVNIYDLSVYENQEDHELQYIKMTARNVRNSTDKMLELQSPHFKIDVTGAYTFDNVSAHFNNLVAVIAPTYVKKVEFKKPVDESFNFGADLIDVTLWTKLFFPEIEIAKRTNILGKYDSKTDHFNFEMNSGYIRYGAYQVDGLSIKMVNSEATNSHTLAEIKVGNFALPMEDSSYQNITFKADIDKTKMDSDLSFFNKSDDSEASLKLYSEILDPNRFKLKLKPSYGSFGGQRWDVLQERNIEIDSTYIKVIDEIAFVNGKQKISIKGIISENDKQPLDLKIEHFRMDNFSYMNEDSTRVDFFGEINGGGFISNVYDNIIFATDVNIDSMGVNDYLVGDFKLVNYWDNENKRIRSVGELKRKDQLSLYVTGYYYAEKEKNNLDYKLEFKETNLAFLNAFLPSDISNFNSLATGVVNVTGSPDETDLKGTLNFENGAVKVNMLNTSYFFGGKVHIDKDMIYFDRMPIEDVRGNHASANGTIIHDYFKNWNYDFTLDFHKLLCLNTTEEQNSLYYGKAYASGDLEVEGYGDNIIIDVRAKSEKGTKVVLPLYGASEVSVSDFVTFISEDTSTKQNKNVSLSGITMNFNLEVTPDAEVKIVFNKTAGDEMVGRGSGNLDMVIDPLGEFNMYGQYVIDDAFYRFTLLDVINKNFIVRKGGTINWYGDPYNADLNLSAVYKVKTSLFDIMPPDIADDYRKATEVNCIMNFKKSLYSPEITFDIEVPKSDENARSMINSIRSSEAELSKQFFALMVMNKFMPLGGSSNREHTSASAFSTPSELLSSQLSNWLSQISDEFDIGINYRPGTNITGEQIEVAFSTQFFDDRVTLSTNVGVSQGSSVNPNNQLIGDFNVEVKLGEDGNMRVRGFNESNQFDIANVTQAPFTQGVGVFYTEEFDKLNETKMLLFIKGIFNKEARDERKRLKAEKDKRKKEREAAEKLGTEGVEDDTHIEE